MTITEALSAYIADRAPIVASPERLVSTTGHLVPHLGMLDAGALTRADIAAYVAARIKEGAQPQTARRELITLRAALRLAWRDGHITQPLPIRLPAAGVPRQRVLSPDEISRLQGAASADEQLALWLAIALATGARRGAIMELTWDRVDLAGRVIDFRAPHPRASRRKNRAVVPIGARLARLLARALKASTTDRVIPCSVYRIHNQFRAACDRASIAGVTPHVLRHTAATALLRQVRLIEASRMLGHRSVAITEQVYGHLTVGDLTAAAAVLDRLLTPR